MLEAICAGDLPRWRFLGNLVGQFAAVKRRERIGGLVNYVGFLYLFFSRTDAEVWAHKKEVLTGFDGPFRRIRAETRDRAE